MLLHLCIIVLLALIIRNTQARLLSMTGMDCSSSRDSIDIRVVRIKLDEVLVDNVWVLLDNH